jgi:hypothetical protein
MIVNTKHGGDLIFVHINKTGGQSVNNFLTNFSKVHLSHSHHTLFQLRSLIQQDIFDKAFKFSIVRNPWDRAVSTFFFRHSKSRAERLSFFIDRETCDKKGFNEWIKKISDSLDEAKNSFPDSHKLVPFHIGDCLEWISYNNKILVDKIYRFENLSELETHLNKLTQSSFKLPHLNPSPLKEKGGYHKYYNDDSIEFIEKICSRDIEMFNYRFEEKEEQ